MLEDAAFPGFAGWYIAGARPAMSLFPALWAAIRHLFARWLRGATLGRMGFLFADLLKGDWASRMSVLLWMGLDCAGGVMTLNRGGNLEIDWPVDQSRPLYDAIIKATKSFGAFVDAEVTFPLPTWLWPIRRNVTVHSLGGCGLADTSDLGVTNADAARFGEVFGYSGLYVADGALAPTALGANPVATIVALSEMVARGITGMFPSDEL